MKNSGYYIVFEGPGGSGKSTVCRFLIKELLEKDVPVVTTREPGGPPEAEAIRENLFALRRAGRLSPREELRMVYQARTLNMEWTLAQLDEGRVVVKDRDYVSTRAFQRASGVNDEEILAVHRQEYDQRDFPLPDLRLLLFVDMKTGMKRRQAEGSQGDVFDEEEERFLREVYGSYAAMALGISRNPWCLGGTTKVIDGRLPLEVVKWQVWREVGGRLGLLEEGNEGKLVYGSERQGRRYDPERW